jgi:hypothetical protein
MAVMWTDVLADAGVEVLPADADHVELRSTAGHARFRVRRLDRPLKPSAIGPAPSRTSLLVAPRATRTAIAAAERQHWSVVTDAGAVAIRFPGNRWVRRDAASAHPPPAAGQSRGPAPWGLLTVVRRLLERAPLTQVELARQSELGQSRVSQLLKPLAEQRLVRRSSRGWAPEDWDRLCDWWLGRYRGPEGVTTCWYSLDDVPAQAAKAVQVLASTGRVAVSGDAAADLIAPWRRPVQAVVYAERASDLSGAGWTATDASAATLLLVNPKDPGVWPAERLAGEYGNTPLPLADPVQVLWDLAHASGPDAGEAAARWREMLHDRARTIVG